MMKPHFGGAFFCAGRAMTVGHTQRLLAYRFAIRPKIVAEAPYLPLANRRENARRVEDRRAPNKFSKREITFHYCG